MIYIIIEKNNKKGVIEMNIDIEFYKVFCLVAEKGSFSHGG
jgi:hypothetical protein